MNNTIKELFNRKSVRVFEKKKISQEEKQLLFDVAIQAPSAGNMQLFSIIDITDQAIKDKLAKSCDNQPFIKEGDTILVFVADYQKWYDAYRLNHSDARTPGVGDLYLASNDAFIAAQNVVVAAESLGIGSCYIGDIIENYEYHKELLGIPQYACPIVMLVLGYPATSQINRKKAPRIDSKYIVSENKYQKYDDKQIKEMFDDKASKFNKTGKEYVENLYKRKWSQPFIEEMTRSYQCWLDQFVKK